MLGREPVARRAKKLLASLARLEEFLITDITRFRIADFTAFDRDLA